jgi:pyridoxamine 5'-phosphate oxidase
LEALRAGQTRPLRQDVFVTDHSASHPSEPDPAAAHGPTGPAEVTVSGLAVPDPAETELVVPDPAVMREQYRSTPLDETALAERPMDQFARWFAEAAAAALMEPNAMVVATVGPDGRPSTRTVLLKQYDERGFVFFTNYASRKGREIDANPYVSLIFPWHPLARQIIVTGTASRIGRDETVAYFRTRPHGSQLGAWASEQSSVVASREELLRRYEELAARYPEGEQVPAPPQWGGIRVVPDAVEFWQGHENRLHDRLRYVRTGTGAEPDTGKGGWTVERLAP